MAWWFGDGFRRLTQNSLDKTKGSLDFSDELVAIFHSFKNECLSMVNFFSSIFKITCSPRASISADALSCFLMTTWWTWMPASLSRSSPTSAPGGFQVCHAEALSWHDLFLWFRLCCWPSAANKLLEPQFRMWSVTIKVKQMSSDLFCTRLTKLPSN